MYHFYHTPVFVLAAENVSEGSRLLSLFTRELGLVKVHARSIREERSKLRGFLQPLSFAEVALVRGRELWRLTTAGGGEMHLSAHLSWSHFRSLRKVVALLERVLQGEAQDRELYHVFCEGMSQLGNCPEERLSGWELLMSSRLLSLLGYGDLALVDTDLAHASWDVALLQAHEKGRALTQFSSQALSASQL